MAKTDPDRRPTAAAVVAGLTLSSLYLVFVSFYSVNGFLADDGAFVHLVHETTGGHLSLGLLWAEHGGHRLLFPNLIELGIAVTTHDNTKTTVFLSAIVFVISFCVFLFLAGTYARRRTTLPVVVALGLLWFSLADWQNALWAFQFAWYLVLLLLMVLLALLLSRSSERPQHWRFISAIGVAVVASFSSFQGLFLWPIGLTILAWELHGSPKHWPARARKELIAWIVMAVITAGVYFHDYSGGYLTTGDKVRMVQSVLANIGNVFPTNTAFVGLHEIIGVVLLGAAGLVVVVSIRNRNRTGENPLPICLIEFAVLFDLSVSASHLPLGFTVLLAPRYTMANLLIPLALVSFGLARLPKQGGWRAYRPRSTTSRVADRVLLALIVGLIVVQSVVATVYGVHQADKQRQLLLTANRIVVNRPRIPQSKRLCYALAVYADTGVFGQGPFDEAQQDHLSMFSPGPHEKYLAEGLPRSVRC